MDAVFFYSKFDYFVYFFYTVFWQEVFFIYLRAVVLKGTARYIFIIIISFIIISTVGIVCYEIFQKNQQDSKKSSENNEIAPETIYLHEVDTGQEMVTTGSSAQESYVSPEVSEEEERSVNEKLTSVEGLSPDSETGYIFVGDSRFVNMNDVCKISDEDNLFMVAKVGQGYNWFSQTAVSQIKRIVSSRLFDEWKLIICLGINDLENIKKYTVKYEELSENYDITLVSVNPVDNYGSLTNAKVQEFNSTLRNISLPYIDTYGLLTSTGYTTTDGLHYNSDTTKKIYKGILLGLYELDPSELSSDSEGILDKTGRSTKNSLQKQILAENKYVKETPVIQAASVNAATPVPADTPALAPAQAVPENPASDPNAATVEIDQELLDFLYGKTGSSEAGESGGSESTGENPGGESSEGGEAEYPPEEE